MPTQNLKIDGKRLWDTLMETARFGATLKGGLCRLTLSDSDRQVRDWFKAQSEALGLAVTIDDMGNMFARRLGASRSNHPPIAMGSHLDTQPTGGKFDGVLGVLAALEAMRTLVAAGYDTHAPIEIVNWTNEEGARFAPPMLASGVFAGVFSRDYAYARADRDGKTFGAELERIGYQGCTPAVAPRERFSAMFELHIEQGPILEAEGKQIGVVQGAQGVRWYEVTVTGQEAHTGATPMTMRKNALLGAARMIERVDIIARAHPPDAVGSVGLIESRPNSRNVVPGDVFFSVDFRHPDEAVLDAMEAELRAGLPAVLTPMGLTFSEACIWSAAPVKFSAQLIDCVRAGAAAAGLSTRDMISGAGHDACYVSRVAPTTMIFVPCAGGISHNEAESAAPDECAAGAQVLLNAVLEFDRRLG